jgi:hypothetical protein
VARVLVLYDSRAGLVCGLAEGVYPTRPREDSILQDADRAHVPDDLAPSTARTGTEHRHLLAALAAARGERVLTYPRGDLRRSVERAPSRWLLEMVERSMLAVFPTTASVCRSISAGPTATGQGDSRITALNESRENFGVPPYRS